MSALSRELRAWIAKIEEPDLRASLERALDRYDTPPVATCDHEVPLSEPCPKCAEISPGQRKSTGIYGDVWFFPDQSGSGS